MAIHMSQAAAHFLFGGDLESKLNIHLKGSTFRLLLLQLVQLTSDSSQIVIRGIDYPVTTANFPCLDTVDSRSVHPILRLLLETVGVQVTVGNEKYSDVKYLVTGIDANYTALITQAYKDSGGQGVTTSAVLQHKHLGIPIPGDWVKFALSDHPPVRQVTEPMEKTLEDLTKETWVQHIMASEVQKSIRDKRPKLITFHDSTEGGWGYITLITGGNANWIDKMYEALGSSESESLEVRKKLVQKAISFGIGITAEASVHMAWLLYSVRTYPTLDNQKPLSEAEDWIRQYVRIRLVDLGIDPELYYADYSA